MVCARNFIFGVHIDHQGDLREKKCKNRSKGLGKMSSDVILVLSIKAKPGVDFQLYVLWKNQYDVISLPGVLSFGCNLVSIC